MASNQKWASSGVSAGDSSARFQSQRLAWRPTFARSSRAAQAAASKGCGSGRTSGGSLRHGAQNQSAGSRAMVCVTAVFAVGLGGLTLAGHMEAPSGWLTLKSRTLWRPGERSARSVAEKVGRARTLDRETAAGFDD